MNIFGLIFTGSIIAIIVNLVMLFTGKLSPSIAIKKDTLEIINQRVAFLFWYQIVILVLSLISAFYWAFKFL